MFISRSGAQETSFLRFHSEAQTFNSMTSSTLKLSKSSLLSCTNSEKQNPPERELYRQE